MRNNNSYKQPVRSNTYSKLDKVDDQIRNVEATIVNSGLGYKIRQFFSLLKPEYYVLHYVIGVPLWMFVVETSVGLKTEFDINNQKMVFTYVYATLSLILFPYSAVLWEAIKAKLFGGHYIIVAGLFFFVVMIAIKCSLYFAACFLGPIGFVYAWNKVYRPHN